MTFVRLCALAAALSLPMAVQAQSWNPMDHNTVATEKKKVSPKKTPTKKVPAKKKAK